MKRYSSSQDFMDEFVAKTRERFDAMEYYRKAEGMPEVPIENLEKNGKIYDMWALAFMDNMVDKWVFMPENKDKYPEHKELSRKLFSADAVKDEKERKELWREYKKVRYQIFQEMPKDKEEIRKNFEQIAERNIVWRYATKNKGNCAKEFEEYISSAKTQSASEKENMVHSLYEKIPEDERKKLRKEYFSSIIHMKQANIKMHCEDRSVGIGARDEGYCLRAITDVLHTMTEGKGVLGELTAENMSPEDFVLHLKEDETTKNFVFRACGERGFEDLVSQGVKPGALVLAVGKSGKAVHAMFWDGTLNENGDAELFGFNSEDKNIKASKKANEETRDMWVVDISGIIAQEFEKNPEFENLAKKDETKSFEASLLAQLKRNRNNGKI